MIAAIVLALAPIALVVQDASGTDDSALSASLSRALAADGRAVQPASAESVVLQVRAGRDGLYELEARRQERVARAHVRVQSAHAFEQARALALDALALVDQVSRPVRPPPPDLPVDETPPEPSAPPPAPPIPPLADEPPPAEPSALEALRADLDVDVPPIEAPPAIPAIPPPPPPPPPKPTPVPPRRVIASEAPPAKPRPSPWAMPANPHLGLEAGGGMLSVASGTSTWSGVGYVAVRGVVRSWELKLRAAVTSEHRDPLALFASTPLSALQSLRLGVGLEGVVIETSAPSVHHEPPAVGWGFSPGVAVDIEYRFPLGRFGFSADGTVSWHAPETGRSAYPTWTALVALGVDVTLW